MSNPEIAINFEKEHLRNAEESDYMVMENLITRRYENDTEEDDENDASGLYTKNPALINAAMETKEFRRSENDTEEDDENNASSLYTKNPALLNAAMETKEFRRYENDTEGDDENDASGLYTKNPALLNAAMETKEFRTNSLSGRSMLRRSGAVEAEPSYTARIGNVRTTTYTFKEEDIE